MTTTLTKVTATELARQLSDILNRIEYRGERFVIVRNGKPIATLEPSGSDRKPTVQDFVDAINQMPRFGPDFADALEEVIAHQSKTDPPEWG